MEVDKNLVLVLVAGVILLTFLFVKLFPRLICPFLDICCIAGLVLKFASDCILEIYALNWLRLINFGFGSGTDQLLFAVRLFIGAILVPLGLYFFVKFLDSSHMTDKKLLGKGSLCHLTVVATTIVIRGLILDKQCDRISGSNVDYCINCPLAKGSWVWGYTVGSIMWLCMCGMQLLIAPSTHEKSE